jgi:hypothetical protein
MKSDSQIRVGAGGNTARPKRASATSRVNALAVQNGNLGVNPLLTVGGAVGPAPFQRERNNMTQGRDGVGNEVQWMIFRDLVKPLCCREKLRPKHWQRALFDYFDCECGTGNGVAPDVYPVIERTIDEMMRESRPWCNPQVFDEAGARAALKKAFDTILAAQDSTGTGVQSVVDVESPSPVDVAARTAELACELGI